MQIDSSAAAAAAANTNEISKKDTAKRALFEYMFMIFAAFC